MVGAEYTTDMSIFVDVTPARKPKTANARLIAIFLAAIFTIMAVAQLFTFEDFPALIADFLLPTGTGAAELIAALVVALEVLAIPFLLGTALSPLMRWFSMVSGWIVVLFWFKTSVWLNVTDAAVTTAGFLGTTVKIPSGWWTVFFSLGLVVLMVWASWGLWPGRRSHK